MAVSLSLTLTESSASQANNTSVVKAVLKAKSTNGSYNNNSKSGYITIDGTKYTFSHSFAKNTTTTLATKSKTITHNSDGSKSITVKGYYQTGVSSGNISTSKTMTLTKIARLFTVSYNANGGSGAPANQTKTYGVTLTLSATKPTRAGYTFKGWATSSGGGVAYNAGGSYTSNSAVTLYAVWKLARQLNAGSVLKSYRTSTDTSTTLDDVGQYGYVQVTSVMSGTLANTITASAKYKATTSSTWTNISGVTVTNDSKAEGVASQTATITAKGFSLDLNSSYTVQITATDQDGHQVTMVGTISQGFFTLDFQKGGKEIAVGSPAVTSSLPANGQFTCAMDFVLVQGNNKYRIKVDSGGNVVAELI